LLQCVHIIAIIVQIHRIRISRKHKSQHDDTSEQRLDHPGTNTQNHPQTFKPGSIFNLAGNLSGFHNMINDNPINRYFNNFPFRRETQADVFAQLFGSQLVSSAIASNLSNMYSGMRRYSNQGPMIVHVPSPETHRSLPAIEMTRAQALPEVQRVFDADSAINNFVRVSRPSIPREFDDSINLSMREIGAEIIPDEESRALRKQVLSKSLSDGNMLPKIAQSCGNIDGSTSVNLKRKSIHV